jgi:hypothetical protein
MCQYQGMTPLSPLQKQAAEHIHRAHTQIGHDYTRGQLDTYSKDTRQKIAEFVAKAPKERLQAIVAKDTARHGLPDIDYQKRWP